MSEQTIELEDVFRSTPQADTFNQSEDCVLAVGRDGKLNKHKSSNLMTSRGYTKTLSFPTGIGWFRIAKIQSCGTGIISLSTTSGSVPASFCQVVFGVRWWSVVNESMSNVLVTQGMSGTFGKMRIVSLGANNVVIDIYKANKNEASLYIGINCGIRTEIDNQPELVTEEPTAYKEFDLTKIGGGNSQIHKVLQSFQVAILPKSATEKKHNRRKVAFTHCLN